MHFKNKTKQVMLVNSSSHDDLWFRDRVRYGFVRKNFPAIDVNLIFDNDVFAQNGDIFQSDLVEIHR